VVALDTPWTRPGHLEATSILLRAWIPAWKGLDAASPAWTPDTGLEAASPAWTPDTGLERGLTFDNAHLSNVRRVTLAGA
jgi:hypothetical protein